MIESTAETKGSVRTERRRFYIASRPMPAKASGQAVRAHWGIENALHRVPGVTFKDAPASERAMVPKTWPSSATAPSTSPARQKTKKA
jgi:predicted transposase YbfD/YdcC